MPARLAGAVGLAAVAIAACTSSGPGMSSTTPSPPRAPVAKVRIPASPVGVVVDGDTAWVASALGNKVYPVRLPQLQVGAPVAVGRVPLRLTVAKDGVWVSVFGRGGISRVAARETIVRVGQQAEGIATTSDDALWVVDQAGGRVVRVAPGEPRRVSGRARVGVEPRLVAADGTGVVVTNFTSGTVTAVDAALHTRTSARICDSPQGVAVHGNRIAVACTGSGEVVFLDPATLRVVHRVSGLTLADALSYAADGTLLVGLQQGPTLVAISSDYRMLGNAVLGDLLGAANANVAVAALPDGDALLTSPDLNELFRVPKSRLHPE